MKLLLFGTSASLSLALVLKKCNFIFPSRTYPAIPYYCTIFQFSETCALPAAASNEMAVASLILHQKQDGKVHGN